MGRDCHRDAHSLGRCVLRRAVAGGAPGPHWRLMVADGTATRRGECESAMACSGLMAFEARKFCVPRVRKTVSRVCRSRVAERHSCNGTSRHQSCDLARPWRVGLPDAPQRSWCERQRRARRGHDEGRVRPWSRRRRSAAQRCCRVEWERRPHPAAVAHTSMTSLTIAGVHFGAVSQVTGQALFAHAPVTGAGVERILGPARMTAGRRAGRGRRDWRLLLVRIVARSALPAVRISSFVEVGQEPPHLVAAETFRLARHERATRRIGGGECRNVGGE